MEIKELMNFARRANKRIDLNYLPNYDSEKKILHSVVKINEEAGELCDSVLASLGSQRSKKMKNYNSENLGMEVADVILSTLLLADLAEVNVEEVLKNKINKVDARYDENGMERN